MLAERAKQTSNWMLAHPTVRHIVIDVSAVVLMLGGFLWAQSRERARAAKETQPEDVFAELQVVKALIQGWTDDRFRGKDARELAKIMVGAIESGDTKELQSWIKNGEDTTP